MHPLPSCTWRVKMHFQPAVAATLSWCIQYMLYLSVTGAAWLAFSIEFAGQGNLLIEPLYE